MLQETKVINFLWHGRDKQGSIIHGEISAKNYATAKYLLQKRGIITTKIYQSHYKYIALRLKNITYNDITLITRQLATLLTAGIPLLQSLHTINKSLTHLYLQDILSKIINQIEHGHSLSETLQLYPRYFDKIYCHLVAAAEKSGCLDDVLIKISSQRERFAKIKSQIIHALIYPTAIVAVAIIVSVILLKYVVPNFKNLFSDFGAKLPWITEWVISLSELLQNYYYSFLLIVLLFIVITGIAKRKMHNFSNYCDRVILKIPLIGNLVRNAAIARFCDILSITFSAGVPLITGITAAGNVANNHVFWLASQIIGQQVAKGEMLHHAMRKTTIFPEMVLQMVYIGEEAGSLEHMLAKIAAFYQQEVDNTIAILRHLSEPIIISILGLIIGGLVFAMYLPIFNLGSVV